MPDIFDVKRLAREHPLYDEDKFEIAVPKEYGLERQNPWHNAIAGRIADIVSTGHALSRGKGLQEGNPTLKWAGNSPAKTMLGLAATDIAAIPLIKMIEKKNPKLAHGMLKGLGGLGAGLSMQNYNKERKYEK